MNFFTLLAVFAMVGLVVGDGPDDLFQNFQGGLVDSDPFSDLGPGAINFDQFATPPAKTDGNSKAFAGNIFGIYGEYNSSMDTVAQVAAISGDNFGGGRLNATADAQSFDGKGTYVGGINVLTAETTNRSSEVTLDSFQVALSNGEGRTEVELDGAGVSVADNSRGSFEVFGRDVDEGEDSDSTVVASGFTRSDDLLGSISNSTVCAGANCNP